MRLIASVIVSLSVLSPLAASAKGMTVIERYESKTNLSSSWERPENRKLIEERLRIHHTNSQTKEFFESSFEANKVEIQKYSDSFKCFSGIKNACRTSVTAQDAAK